MATRPSLGLSHLNRVTRSPRGFGFQKHLWYTRRVLCSCKRTGWGIMSQPVLMYTVGHSNHTTEAFLELVSRHDITHVIDVRSQPYSRWAPQFNRNPLEQSLEEADIAYRFMGDVLGGRPSSPDLYSSGSPDCQRMERDAAYQGGIDQLLELSETERVALMCSEGDYRQCHRHRLIAQTVLKRGALVLHIKPDGATVKAERIAEQLSLF